MGSQGSCSWQWWCLREHWPEAFGIFQIPWHLLKGMVHLITPSCASKFHVCLLSLLTWFGHSWVLGAGQDFQTGIVGKGNKATEEQMNLKWTVGIVFIYIYICRRYCASRNIHSFWGDAPHPGTHFQFTWGEQYSSLNQESLIKVWLNPRIFAKNIRKDTTSLFWSWSWKYFALMPLFAIMWPQGDTL